MNIRFLKTPEIQELYNAVKDNLDVYKKGSFSFLEEDSTKYFEVNQQIDMDIISRIWCENDDDRDIVNCELMFSALSDTTPFMARDERLWTYLTHTCLLDYSRLRWPIPDEDEKAVKHIRTHFFANGTRGIERDNAASRLWWIAYIVSRCQSIPLKEALNVFLFRSDVRANIIERPTTAQNTEIFSSIVEKLYDSYHEDKSLFGRKVFREFMIELNVYGGAILLESLDKKVIDNIVSSIVYS